MLVGSRLGFFNSTYTASATQFSASPTAYVRKASGVWSSLPSTSGTGIVSMWIKFDSGDSVQQYLIEDLGGDSFEIIRNSSNKLEFVASNTGFTNVYDLASTPTVTADGNWHHLLCSWDAAHNSGSRSISMYIDDTSASPSIVADTGTSNTHNYANDTVITIADGSVGFPGAMSEVYFCPGTYMDFSVTANRRKFRSASGKPVSLGSNGSAPTGSQPVLYLNHIYSSFPTNLGYGGDLAAAGGTALTAASTHP